MGIARLELLQIFWHQTFMGEGCWTLQTVSKRIKFKTNNKYEQETSRWTTTKNGITEIIGNLCIAAIINSNHIPYGKNN